MDAILSSPEVIELNNEFSNNTPLSMDSFESEECLGVGGYGKVFRVTDKHTKKEYALKIMNSIQLTRQ